MPRALTVCRGNMPRLRLECPAGAARAAAAVSAAGACTPVASAPECGLRRAAIGPGAPATGARQGAARRAPVGAGTPFMTTARATDGGPRWTGRCSCFAGADYDNASSWFQSSEDWGESADVCSSKGAPTQEKTKSHKLRVRGSGPSISATITHGGTYRVRTRPKLGVSSKGVATGFGVVADKIGAAKQALNGNMALALPVA